MGRSGCPGSRGNRGRRKGYRQQIGPEVLAPRWRALRETETVRRIGPCDRIIAVELPIFHAGSGKAGELVADPTTFDLNTPGADEAATRSVETAVVARVDFAQVEN